MRLTLFLSALLATASTSLALSNARPVSGMALTGRKAEPAPVSPASPGSLEERNSQCGSRVSYCQSRGSGWGCDSNCNCTPPPTNPPQCTQDASWDRCQTRGPGWGCDDQCVCSPPPGDCPYNDKWEQCYSVGKTCNKQCECVCTTWAKNYCQQQKGTLNSDCTCTVPTKAWGTKRDATNRHRLCPTNLHACPVDPAAKRQVYECLDVSTMLDSCGGCATEGTGVDCASIEGVVDVSCFGGQCRVEACDRGFQIAGNGTTCEPITSSEASTGKVLFGVVSSAEKVLGMGW